MSYTIVALPTEDDYVNKISSERIPHMTLIYLGDELSGQGIVHITDFVEHAVSIMASRFGMNVDHRGTLGPDKADVLFFDTKYGGYDKINQLRKALLQDNTINAAYNSVEQYPTWTPHLTLGYPESPAKEDDRDYPGIHWVQFDKIAFWIGDYAGPEFQLSSEDYGLEVAMSEKVQDFIEHHGVKGQKWGVRRKNRKGKSTSLESQARGKSDEQLKKDVERLRLEQQFVQISKSLNNQKPIKTVLAKHGGQAASIAVGSATSFVVGAALKKAMGSK